MNRGLLAVAILLFISACGTNAPRNCVDGKTHIWSKWEDTGHMGVNGNNDKAIEQKRYCKKCGRVQIEFNH